MEYSMSSTRQKGNQYENKVVESIYLPVDKTAENVGGGARKRYAGDIKTLYEIDGKILVPECKNNKGMSFLTDFEQSIEQAKRVDGIPVLHKNIHKKHFDVAIMKGEDFAKLLKQAGYKLDMDRKGTKQVVGHIRNLDLPVGWDTLTTKEQEVFKLKELEGMSLWKNIAKRAGLSSDKSAKMMFENAKEKISRAELKYYK